MQNESHIVNYFETNSKVISLLDGARNDWRVSDYSSAKKKITFAKTAIRMHRNLFIECGDEMDLSHHQRLNNLLRRVNRYQGELNKLEKIQ